MKATIRDKSHKLPGVFELIMPSFEALRVNILPYILLLLAPSLVSSLLGGETEPVETIADIQAFTTSSVFITTILISLVLSPTLFYVQLKSARGDKITIRQALELGIRVLPRFGALMILLGVAVILGLTLFVLPGLIILKRYMLSPYYLLDDDCSIGQALKQSQQDTQSFSKSIWGLIGFGALLYVLSIVSLVITPLLILLIILEVSYTFMPALRYHQIREQLGWKFEGKPIPPKKSQSPL